MQYLKEITIILIVAYLQEGRNILRVEIFLSFLSHCCFRSGPGELAALKFVLVLKLMMVCLFVTLTSHAHHHLQTVPAPPPSQQYS